MPNRQELIDSGRIIDVTQEARLVGFGVPVMLSSQAETLLFKHAPKDDGSGDMNLRRARLYGLLKTTLEGIHQRPNDNVLEFDIRMGIKDTAHVMDFSIVISPEERKSRIILPGQEQAPINQELCVYILHKKEDIYMEFSEAPSLEIVKPDEGEKIKSDMAGTMNKGKRKRLQKQLEKRHRRQVFRAQ